MNVCAKCTVKYKGKGSLSRDRKSLLCPLCARLEVIEDSVKYIADRLKEGDIK